MANTLLWSPGIVSAYADAGFTVTDFNGLASGSVAVSAPIDNRLNADTFMDVSFSLTVGGTTTAGSYLSLYLLPLNQDGTTYGDGTTTLATNAPAFTYWQTNAGVRVGVTSGNAVVGTFPRVQIPNAKFVLAIVNNSGVALNAAAAASVKYRTADLQAGQVAGSTTVVSADFAASAAISRTQQTDQASQTAALASRQQDLAEQIEWAAGSVAAQLLAPSPQVNQRQHPLAKRLALYVRPRLDRVTNVADGRTTFTGSATSLSSTPYGSNTGLLVNADSASPQFARGYVPLTTSDGAGTGDYTVAVIANPTSESAGRFLFAQGEWGGPWTGTGLVVNQDHANNALSGCISLSAVDANITNRWGASSAGGILDGNYHVFLATRANGIYNVYVDGALKTNAATNGSPNINDPNQILRLGNIADHDGANAYANCNIVVWAAWNRSLTQHEITAFTRDYLRPIKAAEPLVWSHRLLPLSNAGTGIGGITGGGGTGGTGGGTGGSGSGTGATGFTFFDAPTQARATTQFLPQRNSVTNIP